MKFTIKILKIEVTSKAGANGKTIQTMEVSYNNLDSGKIESRKLTLFYNKVVCNALANAKMDDQYTITSEKEGEYWVWKEAVQAAPGGQPSVPGEPAKAPYTPAAKSTYETPEERARRQVLIVRQSALAQAVALLTAVPALKTPPSRELVLQEAQAFVDWVFEVTSPSIMDLENDIPD